MTINFDAIASQATLKEALLQLKVELEPAGARELIYGHMLWPRSHVRHDGVLVKTLDPALVELYADGGGLTTDPVAERFWELEGPYCVDVSAMIRGDVWDNVHNNRYSRAMLAAGHGAFCSFPFRDHEGMGMVALTIYVAGVAELRRLHTQNLMGVARNFHRLMKRGGQLGGYFSLTEKEIEALRAATQGRAADWLAERDGVTVRAIELRLRSARKKLLARNTTEAVYKATAYGLLRHSWPRSENGG